jgi:ABC-type sugar transport system permease subunit
MLHPLFSTIVQRPDLVMDHLSAYASLFHKEASSAGSELLARLVAGVVAIMALVVFLGLAGTSLMLGLLQNHFHWVLIAVPGSALVLLALAVMVAMKPLKSERFPELKAQVDSDAQALRTVA